jgi:glycerate 2-kinase
MKIVIAPDKFKGSRRAAEVGAAIGAGLRAELPGAELVIIPVADGGDGTVDAAVAAGLERVPVTVDGPTGEPVAASYARRGELAVVELAIACGLLRLPGGRLAPLTASSFGAGQMLAAALEAGARRIIFGVGGSASTDGGTGMLQALGARVLDARGEPLARGGGALRDVAALDLAGLHPAWHDRSVILATDVINPLTGPDGAAVVYGPQKGASPAQIGELDRGLRRWAAVVADATGTGWPRAPATGAAGGDWSQAQGAGAAGRDWSQAPGAGAAGRDWSQAPGAGAAGGVGFAALAVLGAERRLGIGVMLDLLDFDAALEGADLVITGEGSLDAQTLAGKAPAGVAQAAAGHGIPVVAVAGRCTLTADQLAAAGFAAVYPLSDLEPDPARSSAEASVLLRRVGQTVAGQVAALARQRAADEPAGW